MEQCIHVRTTPNGPALGLTDGDQSHLCSKVTIHDIYEPAQVAVIEATEAGVTVTVAQGFEARVG